jgi:hypothetical protein
MMIDHHVAVMIVQVQVVHDGMMLAQAVVAMTDQVPVVQVLVVRSVNVPIGQPAVVTIDQVRAARVETTIDHRVVVMTDQVLVVHFVNVPIGRPQADRDVMMIDPRAVVTIDQVQVDQALVVHFVNVPIGRRRVVHDEMMIDRREVGTTDQVPVAQVPVDRFAVVMIDPVAVGKIVVIFLRVRRLPRNVKPMKFITVPVVASTAKNRCLLLNTQLSAGKMMVQ